jgi:hypothetical protein
MAAKTRKSWRDVVPIHPAAELLPRPSPDELRELGEDIKRNGLLTPVSFYRDEHGEDSLLDGISRLDAMVLAGVPFTLHKGQPNPKIPPEWMIGTPPRAPLLMAGACYHRGDPYAYVMSANLIRRHLTAEQKRELIAKLLKATPEKSNRQIAETTKASHVTVGAMRAELQSTGQIDQLTKTVGKDGKARKQPARKPSTKDPHIQAAVDRAFARSEQTRRKTEARTEPALSERVDIPASLRRSQ